MSSCYFLLVTSEVEGFSSVWTWAIRRKNPGCSDTALCQEHELFSAASEASLSLKIPAGLNLYGYCYVIFDPSQPVGASERGDGQIQHVHTCA